MEASKKYGPVFETVKYLDKNAERIKAGRLSRIEAMAALEAKGVNRATASGTLLKWTRTTGAVWAKKPRRKAAS